MASASQLKQVAPAARPAARAWGRVALAIGVSAAMVLVIAGLFPRMYLANDDVGLTEYLRADTFTPWISPLLSQALRAAYRNLPDVPWWGLYQYALIFATGAVLIHTCLELIDRRPGLGHTATLLGGLVLIASHAILVVGITWTTVSISAIGTGAAAFVAHLQCSHAAGARASWARTLIYGLLVVAGYMLRLQGLGAIAVALLPVAAWAGLRFLQRRHLPRPAAVIAFVAPLALVMALQGQAPRGWDDTPDFEDWTNERGRIHGHAAFEGLAERAPELLERAGWATQDYRDFVSWLIIDERDFPVEKVRRLLATGGVPELITPEWNYRQLRIIYDESAVSVVLFFTFVVGGVVMAFLGLIERGRGIGFSLGYLVFLIGLPLWMVANYRFPQRVSLSFYSVAALGLFVYLARRIADRPADPEPIAPRDWRPAAGLAVIALCLFVWARHLIVWIDGRPPWLHRDALQALDERTAARGGFVFVYVQTGVVEFDPLRARPRAYDGLQGGWGTFSTPWYGTIKKLGVSRGADVLPAMVNNPDAYLLAGPGARDVLEDWIRRKLHHPGIRLALVDGADIPDLSRPELYRLVTTPLVKGSEEWNMLARFQWTLTGALPGAPDVSGLPFRRIALGPPLAQHAWAAREPTAHVALEPIDGGVRALVTGEAGDGCVVTSDDPDGGAGPAGGVRVPITGLRAARFHIELIAPENIIGFNVYAHTAAGRSVRWRSRLDAQAQQFGYQGAVTLVPGYPAHLLARAVDNARRSELRELQIFVVVKPGTRAGFALRDLEIAEP